MRRRTAGLSLIEVLLCGAVAIVLGTGVWTLARSTYDSHYELLNQNSALAEGRQGVDTLTDSLRGATALTAAAASDVTYTDSASASVRYWKSGTNLVRSINGSPAEGTVIVKDLQSLSIVYWSWTGSAWTTSSAPGTLSQVKAAVVTAAFRIDGLGRQMTSSVKFRNL